MAASPIIHITGWAEPVTALAIRDAVLTHSVRIGVFVGTALRQASALIQEKTVFALKALATVSLGLLFAIGVKCVKASRAPVSNARVGAGTGGRERTDVVVARVVNGVCYAVAVAVMRLKVERLACRSLLFAPVCTHDFSTTVRVARLTVTV